MVSTLFTSGFAASPSKLSRQVMESHQSCGQTNPLVCQPCWSDVTSQQREHIVGLLGSTSGALRLLKFIDNQELSTYVMVQVVENGYGHKIFAFVICLDVFGPRQYASSDSVALYGVNRFCCYPVSGHEIYRLSLKQPACNARTAPGLQRRCGGRA